jgi:hypothetical protein
LPEENKLPKLLEDLNGNIQTLSKLTALSFRKDSLFQGKETKQEQLEVLEELRLPDDIIALIIGSTVDSIYALRSQRKAKAKKNQTDPQKKTEPTKNKKQRPIEKEIEDGKNGPEQPTKQ